MIMKAMVDWKTQARQPPCIRKGAEFAETMQGQSPPRPSCKRSGVVNVVSPLRLASPPFCSCEPVSCMLHGFPKEATKPFFPGDGTSWSWVGVQWLPEPPRPVFSATFSWSREVFAFIHDCLFLTPCSVKGLVLAIDCLTWASRCEVVSMHTLRWDKRRDIVSKFRSCG